MRLITVVELFSYELSVWCTDNMVITIDDIRGLAVVGDETAT